MKEPKEEAERIIEMYYSLTDKCSCYEYLCNCFTMYERKAQQCAILHVEGIVKLVSYPQTNIKRKKYWQEVLQIIKDK
jgi:hypothetical protein